MIFDHSFFVFAAEESKQLGLPEQVQNFFNFSLGIAGVVALGVLVYGAILYTTSAGNIPRQKDATDWMKGAIIGLIILFGSYLILSVIDPRLVKLNDIILPRNPSVSNQPLPVPGNQPVVAPIFSFPFGEGVALRDLGIGCNDYGACAVHSSGCALLNKNGAFCRNNIIASGNCGTKLNSTLVNDLLAARDTGFKIYVNSSVCGTSHAQSSFHYQLLAADLALPSSNEEIRALMSFLGSRKCVHDIWGPSRFSGLCVDEGRRGVVCNVPEHEDHIHYDVWPNCQ